MSIRATEGGWSNDYWVLRRTPEREVFALRRRLGMGIFFLPCFFGL